MSQTVSDPLTSAEGQGDYFLSGKGRGHSPALQAEPITTPPSGMRTGAAGKAP